MKLLTKLFIYNTVLISVIATALSTNAQTNVDTTKIKSASFLNSIIKYTAHDSIKSFLESKKIVLIKNGFVKYEDIELNAYKIEIDFNKSEVIAYGRTDSLGNYVEFPIFKEGTDKYESKRIRYNFKTKKGIITDAITQQGDGFLHSARTKKQSENIIDLQHGKYTTCNHEHPHYYIALSKARVIQNEKIISGRLNLVISDIPTPIIIPFGFFPFTKQRASGILIPNIGESKSEGFKLENLGYYWAASPYLDLTLYTSLYSFGSYKFQAITNYKKRYRYSGRIDLNYKKIIYSDKSSPDYQNTYAYTIKWTHNQDQKAHPNSTFNANVNLSNSAASKFSNNQQKYLTNTVQSNVNYSNKLVGTPFSFSAQLSHTLNTIKKEVSLKLPSMQLAMARITPFKRKNASGKKRWYEKIGVTYSSKFDNNFTVNEDSLFKASTIDQFKMGVNHAISTNTSIKFLKFINVSPNANYHERWYFNSIRKKYEESLFMSDSSYGRVTIDTINGFNRVYDYSFGASMNTTIYGMMKFKPFMPIEAIRFVHKPSLGISYNPNFSRESYGYYGYITGDPDHTRYSYFSNGIYGTPSTSAAENITFALNNNVEMKIRTPKDTASTTKKISLLDQFNIRSSYNILADSLNLSPIAINANTKLFNKIRVQFSTTLDPYALDSKTYNTINTFEWKKTGKIGRITRASLSTSFSLNPKTFEKRGKKKESNKQAKSNIPNYYNYFNVPWNVAISYQITYTKPKNVKNIIQTLNLSGDFSVTKEWKVGFRTGYDFERNKMSFTSLNINHDMHCWTMGFSWIPFGERQSYSFRINVKASTLKDALKYDKRKTWMDNNYY